MQSNPRDLAIGRCQAKGCGTDVAPDMLMCDRHWALVPASLRDSIEVTYRPGQELDGAASAEYVAFAAAAVAAVAHQETRRASRKRLRPGKPVQLTLFDLG